MDRPITLTEVRKQVNGVAVLTWLAVGLGLALRLRQYLSDRALWLDEVMISLNVLRRSFTQLLQPLDYNQGAPPGFLWLQKVSTLWLGEGEWALRLMPFLAGALALLWFAALARRYLPPAAVPLAVALFALSDSLIYYSAEAKQYAGDVLMAVAVLWLAADMLAAERPGLWRWLGWAAFGAAWVWFSHPAVFMLAGAGGGVLLAWGLRRDWSRLWKSAAVALFWAASFAVFYLFFLRSLSGAQDLQAYWRGDFLELRLSWLLGAFFAMFETWLGSATAASLAAWAGVAGGGVWALQRRVELPVVVLPWLTALVASALHLYPFSGRLILFLAPGAFLLAAAGVHQLLALASQARSSWVGFVLPALLLLEPAYVAAFHFVSPRTTNEIKPVLQYLQQQAQTDDLLYVDWPVNIVLDYYGPRYPLPVREIRYGVESNAWAAQMKDLAQLPARPRVWLLYSHEGSAETEENRTALLSALDLRGQKLDAYLVPGAAVYLYDLSQP